MPYAHLKTVCFRVFPVSFAVIIWDVVIDYTHSEHFLTLSQYEPELESPSLEIFKTFVDVLLRDLA